MIDQHSKTIQIEIDGQEYTVFKNSKNEWDAQERTINDRAGVIKAIVRNVALRYRL